MDRSNFISIRQLFRPKSLIIEGLGFGKLPYEKSKKDIRFANIVRTPVPSIPEFYDTSSILTPYVDNRMFGNDTWGDCVLAERAHQTLVFERFEQGKILTISDNIVLNEYWKEGGASVLNPHPDRGLSMRDSLNAWRKNGWVIDGKRYTIYAHALVNQLGHLEVKACVYLLGGADIGIQIPWSAIKQFKAGKPWDVVNNDGGIVAGHCIYITGYCPSCLFCMTWGKQQAMTWKFLDKYCDEFRGVVDNRNLWMKDSPVDVKKLNEYLKMVTA